MTEEIELVECAPYNARITAKACGLRAMKARILKKKKSAGAAAGVGGYVAALSEVEKCLTCPDARKTKAADKCSIAKCFRSPVERGMCVRHAKMAMVMKTRKKKMAEKEVSPACKDCGRAKTNCTDFNDALSLCSRCTEARGREKSMGLAKAKACTKCGRQPGGADDVGRVYKGLCPKCRGQDKKVRVEVAAPQKKKAPSPRPSLPQQVEVDDIEAVRAIFRALEPFDPPTRERILRWVNERMGVGV